MLLFRCCVYGNNILKKLQNAGVICEYTFRGPFNKEENTRTAINAEKCSDELWRKYRDHIAEDGILVLDKNHKYKRIDFPEEYLNDEAKMMQIVSVDPNEIRWYRNYGVDLSLLNFISAALPDELLYYESTYAGHPHSKGFVVNGIDVYPARKDEKEFIKRFVNYGIPSF